ASHRKAHRLVRPRSSRSHRHPIRTVDQLFALEVRAYCGALAAKERGQIGATIAHRSDEGTGMGILKALRVPLGWKEIFKRLAGAVYKDNLFGWAAELAYYSFLALFPALLFFVALASFFPLHTV